MNARGSLWLPLAILLLLAALSFWIEHAVQVTPNGKQTTETDPVGIMEDFHALRTDAEGRPQYQLSAKRLRHYSSSKLTELESPRFLLLDSQNGDVSAVSKQATVSPDGKEVDLQGEVNVVREAHAGQSAMSLRTARLFVFPERDLLRAPGPVDLQDATLKVHAGAMEYDAKQRLIKLTGRVQARYTSEKR